MVCDHSYDHTVHNAEDDDDEDFEEGHYQVGHVSLVT